MTVKGREFDFVGGEVLLFDKPLYWTSFDLVKKVKNLIRMNQGIKKLKVGHAGTLDPLADGLMIVCTGKKTKTINELQGLSKEYVATIKLGETTPSYDLETPVDKSYPVNHITADNVKEILISRTGEQDQVPPLFSAKNINGKRAYEFARRGEEVEMRKVRINLYNLELLDFKLPYITVKIHCSKGTYIRSFARDIGEWLGSGGHLTALRRTMIGEYRVESAYTLDDFEKIVAASKQY